MWAGGGGGCGEAVWMMLSQVSLLIDDRAPPVLFSAIQGELVCETRVSDLGVFGAFSTRQQGSIRKRFQTWRTERSGFKSHSLLL